MRYQFIVRTPQSTYATLKLDATSANSFLSNINHVIAGSKAAIQFDLFKENEMSEGGILLHGNQKPQLKPASVTIPAEVLRKSTVEQFEFKD